MARKPCSTTVQSLPEQVRSPLPPWDNVTSGSFFFSWPLRRFILSNAHKLPRRFLGATPKKTKRFLPQPGACRTLEKVLLKQGTPLSGSHTLRFGSSHELPMIYEPRSILLRRRLVWQVWSDRTEIHKQPSNRTGGTLTGRVGQRTSWYRTPHD